MKKTNIFAALLLATTLFTVGCKKQQDPIEGSAFGRQLRALDIVNRVDTIIPNSNPANYKELYQVTFTQPIDHNNPAAGTFNQKAYLFYVGDDRPTVFYTNGYSLNKGSAETPFNDIAYNMNANLLMVEHRYFGSSKPANDPRWEYLTISQAAADNHAIIQALKPLLQKEWVSIGTSKDGLASIFLRYFYPDDVTVTTAFCSPVQTSLNNELASTYMQEESGTAEERAQMRAIMERMLENGEEGLYARLLELMRANNISTEGWSYTSYVNDCMQFFFQFFCYETPSTRQLPAIDSPNDTLILKIFNTTFKPERDEDEDYAYSIQSAKQLGCYTQNFSRYANLLAGTSFDANILRRNPCNLKNEDLWLYDSYDNSEMIEIRENFIPNTTCPILLVYSESDPWTGAKIDRINEQYSKMIINPLGIHNHDINTAEHYSAATRQEIMDFIARYVPYNNDPVAAKRAAQPYSHTIKMNDMFMMRNHQR